MKCYYTIALIVFFYTSSFVSSEFYTAIAELGKLLATKETVLKTLETYLEVEEEKLNKIKRLRNQYVNFYRAADGDAESFLSNPINAYLLVKRLTSDWETANKLMECSDKRALVPNITAPDVFFPKREDLLGAAAALIRLQQIYLLDASTLAQGKIEGGHPPAEITAGDCYELGKLAYHGQDYNRSLLWMQETLNRMETDETVKDISKFEILDHMAFAQFRLKNYAAAADLTEKLLEIDPDLERAKKNLEYFRARLSGSLPSQAEDDGPTLPQHNLEPEIVEAYERLCRGESLKTPEEKRHLNCFYTRNNDPYLLLQPVKVEVLNMKPRLEMFYDVLSSAEADIIKRLAIPALSVSTVSNAESGDNEVAFYRISRSAWLLDSEDKLIPKINKRVESITGLSTESAEPLQVLNYGIGGYYEPHYDYVKPGDNISYMYTSGNRMATWIFYLSDVPAGGSTVFPDIRVEVKPVKGAAAFWYNLQKSGEGIPITRHAACPVLSGSKWVANKWIHEFGNEFRRQCTLNPLD